MRTTHQKVLDFISGKIKTLEPKIVVYEVKIVAHEIEGLDEYAKVLARVEDNQELISDNLIVGLKAVTMDATNGVSFDGTKMDWGGRDKLDFVLLLFTVDMMKNCEV